MSDADEQDLASGRDLRDAARGKVTERFAHLKAGLEERGVGARIADATSQKVRAAGREAVEIAAESKGIIVGTVAALALWVLRRPIADQAVKLWPRFRAMVKKEPEA